jgi:hypothetical protein
VALALALLKMFEGISPSPTRSSVYTHTHLFGKEEEAAYRAGGKVGEKQREEGRRE